MRSWQDGLAAFALTFFGLLLLCALLGRRVGLAILPAAIQVAGIAVIALVAGLASAILHAARRRRRLRDWQVRLARVDAALSRAHAPATTGDPASAVMETVTVVLRRQTPPRLDEPPRSWLGGLPMLPDDVAWPRSVSREYPERGDSIPAERSPPMGARGAGLARQKTWSRYPGNLARVERLGAISGCVERTSRRWAEKQVLNRVHLPYGYLLASVDDLRRCGTSSSGLAASSKRRRTLFA